MKIVLKSSKKLNNIMYLRQDFYCNELFHGLLNITSHAEKYRLKLSQFQVDSIWLELTYHIETLPWSLRYDEKSNIYNQQEFPHKIIIQTRHVGKFVKHQSFYYKNFS